MKRAKQRLGATLATVLVLLPLMTPVAHAKTTTSAAAMTQPHQAAYGYYVDTYKNNLKTNQTVSSNPAYGLLSGFNQLWSPADGGHQLNPAILNENTDIAARITQNRTTAEVNRSFLSDRRALPYSIISGLGPFAAAFIKNANAQTDYTETNIPTTPQPANVGYSQVKWADESSKLGSLVKLVDKAYGVGYAGTGAPKGIFQYQRPYRLSSADKPNPLLVNVMKAAKATDFDFPSGHTTSGFETGELLAYAFPERFQQLVTRSSEMGYDRILAGRHSPLATMGGRMVGTAVAASILNDPANQVLMQQAYNDAHSDKLAISPLKTYQDNYGDYQENRKNYRYRMTYGLPKIGDGKQAMRVPKGAEVLLATRLPYLSANQRRMVLATTGFESGYPVMDDAEGWGRLDLFSAANGYGALPTKTTVNMDATQGGFSKQDVWQNDISGAGQLIKRGTGSLTLAGNNQFNGGLQVDGGKLQLSRANAAGKGRVILKKGTLATTVAVKLQQGYQQAKNATLALTVNKATALKIHGKAQLAGKLKLTHVKGLKNHQTLISFGSHSGKFARVYGLPAGWHVQYHTHKLELVRG